MLSLILLSQCVYGPYHQDDSTARLALVRTQLNLRKLVYLPTGNGVGREFCEGTQSGAPMRGLRCGGSSRGPFLRRYGWPRGGRGGAIREDTFERRGYEGWEMERSRERFRRCVVAYSVFPLTDVFLGILPDAHLFVLSWAINLSSIKRMASDTPL